MEKNLQLPELIFFALLLFGPLLVLFLSFELPRIFAWWQLIKINRETLRHAKSMTNIFREMEETSKELRKEVARGFAQKEKEK
ncbi:MAG: hypothetical protein OHK006_12790 [Thermodesulfovibrionales bacterium]